MEVALNIRYYFTVSGMHMHLSLYKKQSAPFLTKKQRCPRENVRLGKDSTVILLNQCLSENNSPKVVDGVS